VLISLLATGAFSKKAQAQSQARSDYPILDAIAQKPVQKYQTSTCEQLWAKKSEEAPPAPGEQKVIQLLQSDAQMRAELINKVAARSPTKCSNAA
jgi:hypothetical protein